MTAVILSLAVFFKPGDGSLAVFDQGSQGTSLRPGDGSFGRFSTRSQSDGSFGRFSTRGTILPAGLGPGGWFSRPV